MARKRALAVAPAATAACRTTTSNDHYSEKPTRGDDAFGLAQMAHVMIATGSVGPAAFPLLIAADTRGYTLYALVHRPMRRISVRFSDGSLRRRTANDDERYRPCRVDAYGQVIDVVVKWAGVPRSNISTRKGQAILLTLGANSVMPNRRSDEFSTIRQRWLAGQYLAVVAERQEEIERRLAES